MMKVSGVFYFSSGGSNNLSGSTFPILDLNDKTTGSYLNNKTS